MERNVRYQVLLNEEEPVAAEPVDLVMVIPPPEYEEATATRQTDLPAYSNKLPSYTTATDLPSYEEAERSKHEEAVGAVDAEALTPLPAMNQVSRQTLGTDGMFLCTFLFSFLFSWIGFLCSLCITDTIAGRCGALAGLGLSIVKWVAIVKHNEWAKDFAHGDSFVWWMVMVCGIFFFVRGSVQYVKLKHQWRRLNGQSVQR